MVLRVNEPITIQEFNLSMHLLPILITDAWKIDTGLGEKVVMKLDGVSVFLPPEYNINLTNDEVKEMPGHYVIPLGSSHLQFESREGIEDIFNIE